MSTGIALCEERRVETIETSGGEDAAPATITTTLHDLIAALQEVVDPGEEALVVATVVSMLRAGRLTWRASARSTLAALHDAVALARGGAPVPVIS